MNDFSMVCRVLGTLFYRQPQDAMLAPLMLLIGEGKLAAHWPLEQDPLLERLQKSCDPQGLAAEYRFLFSGAGAQVSPLRSAWVTADDSDIGTFLRQLGMPAGDGPADHFGALLLAGSWLEDHAQLDETQAQRQLFDFYLLPWSDRFLGKVEACATGDFYRVLAIICREALQALREELDETPAC
ncbi:TorD/DmsD family molecular chaperone [Acerihabitans arboris]|uniref:Molecular chaperone n=1 Tax=Acerihabitans arboris TaxID=2691583 RepID=A0A845SI01_9GAMM|nr:molecular chaperone [Acerihabitans arboris]NDL62584.1 molecular chaperone [Acerihabitans arboris]